MKMKITCHSTKIFLRVSDLLVTYCQIHRPDLSGFMQHKCAATFFLLYAILAMRRIASRFFIGTPADAGVLL